MAGNDYHVVKPVEGLQTISGLTPAKRRDQRRHRRSPQEQKDEQSEQEPKGSTEQLDASDVNDAEEDQQHSIDYRA